MTTINPQIDAAIPLMKARAAEFNSTRIWNGLVYEDVLDRADNNLSRALADREARSPIGPHYQRRQLLDTMNLCALALSLLPKGGSDEPT